MNCTHEGASRSSACDPRGLRRDFWNTAELPEMLDNTLYGPALRFVRFPLNTAKRCRRSRRGATMALPFRSSWRCYCWSLMQVLAIRRHTHGPRQLVLLLELARSHVMRVMQTLGCVTRCERSWVATAPTVTMAA